MRQVASDYPNIDVREVDVMQSVNRMADYQVFITPFIVIDGKLEWVGVPRETDVRKRFAGQRPQVYPSD